MDGIYIGKKLGGKVTGVYIDQEVLDFAEQNRKVEDREAAREAILEHDRDQAMKARNRRSKRAARYHRRMIRMLRQVTAAAIGLGLAILAMELELAASVITIPAMVLCLLAAGLSLGMFLGRGKR